MKKLAIVGSRDYHDYAVFEKHVIFMLNALKVRGGNETCIITGDATGVDAMAIKFAKWYSMEYECISADWNLFGNSAGPIRNENIVKDAVHVLAFWDGKSKGTKSSIKWAKHYKIPTTIIWI